MNRNRPCVSIGLPVFNGEKYLEAAVNSILNQVYPDFELIISDNASTDRTQRICQAYADKDSRIRYCRNEKNIGAPRNFNRVFWLSLGKYFKWAAYDDVLAPEFLEKCVNMLDTDSSIVLCHSKTGRIDERGKVVGNYDHKMMRKIGSRKPHERFSDLISVSGDPCWPIFGVVRTKPLAMTPLFGSYVGADRNLLAEIGLIGRIFEIPEYLFFRRDHPHAYTRSYCEHEFAIDVDNYQKQLAWWTSDDWISLPNWKGCFEYIRSVRRVPMKWHERLLCYEQIWRWFVREGWKFMGSDVENMLLRRSRFGRKVASAVKMNLSRTVISTIKKNVRIA